MNKPNPIERIIEFIQRGFKPGMGPMDDLSSFLKIVVMNACFGQSKNVVTGTTTIEGDQHQIYSFERGRVWFLIHSKDIWLTNEYLESGSSSSSDELINADESPNDDVSNSAFVKCFNEDNPVDTINTMLKKSFWDSEESINGFVTADGTFVGIIGQIPGVVHASVGHDGFNNSFTIGSPARVNSAEELFELCRDLPEEVLADLFRNELPLEQLRVVKETNLPDLVVQFWNQSITIPAISVQRYCKPSLHGTGQILFEQNIPEPLVDYVTHVLTQGTTAKCEFPKELGVNDIVLFIDILDVLGVIIGEELTDESDDKSIIPECCIQ